MRQIPRLAWGWGNRVGSNNQLIKTHVKSTLKKMHIITQRWLGYQKIYQKTEYKKMNDFKG